MFQASEARSNDPPNARRRFKIGAGVEALLRRDGKSSSRPPSAKSSNKQTNWSAATPHDATAIPPTSSAGHSVDLYEDDVDVDDEDDGAAPYPADIPRKLTANGAPPPARRNFFTPPPRQSSAVVSSSMATTPESQPDGASNSGSGSGCGSSAATSVHVLPALQTKGPPDEHDHLEPVEELDDDPANYDLVAPAERPSQGHYSLEQRGEKIFSREHLHAIFREPSFLQDFTAFLGQHKSSSLSTLVYYLDALKALNAIKYANAVADALAPLDGIDFTQEKCPPTANQALETKACHAFDQMVREDLPAYVTRSYVAIVSKSIQRRITGTLPPHLREASEGLAEVFCLTDPSRPDNPIVFASDEFHRTTQYGMNYVIGRNCRFLQGPRTNPDSVRRLREASTAGKDHIETFINYRRDGSPFLNLLMIAPLRDSRGTLRYFIGAQVDVSGLAKEVIDLPALQGMLADEAEGREEESKDEFQQLSEMFNAVELDTVRKHGGQMHRDQNPDEDDSNGQWHRPRLLLKDPSPGMHDQQKDRSLDMAGKNLHGKLAGIYTHYLLVRPYPSLRILFTSPSLRLPGILQSPFMDRIGSSERVREELVSALAEGRGVTAKIRWVSRSDDEGRSRWIHCTPLLGHNGSVGVWMIVLIDEEQSQNQRRYKTAPPISANIERRGLEDGRHLKPRSSATSLNDDNRIGSITSTSHSDYELTVR